MFKGIVLLLIVFSLIAVGIKNLFQKSNAGNHVRNVKKNPAFASKIASNLTAIYGKIGIESFPDLFKNILSIPENTRLDKYLFLHAVQINSNEMLVLTKCNEADFLVSLNGGQKDVKRIYFFSFLIQVDVEKKNYEVYSQIYEDLNEKNLKTDFIAELNKLMTINK
jgi:hypothetical protein